MPFESNEIVEVEVVTVEETKEKKKERKETAWMTLDHELSLIRTNPSRKLARQRKKG